MLEELDKLPLWYDGMIEVLNLPLGTVSHDLPYVQSRPYQAWLNLYLYP